MNNIAMGGVDERTGSPFSYYETLAGGMGASAAGNGESAVHSHMTNTLNTPVEALEHSYPLRVVRYGVRRDSGGPGRFRGGDGIVREIEATSASEITVLSERRRKGPYGLNGAGSGRPGSNSILRDGRTEQMPGKFRANLNKGDRVRIETPGGGGYGSAQ
jgi:N-methylhydantoinase B